MSQSDGGGHRVNPAEIWYGNSLSSQLIRGALLPLSGLYGLGWETYLAIYRFGIKKSQEPHPRVICVGNLVAGGTGKSPVALHIAKLLAELGHSVTIGCSGYGSPRSVAATLAPHGPLDPEEWGDEPAMIRWLAPEFDLVVGRRRVLAAQIAIENDPKGVLVMDDGFQHMPLKKLVNIVLDDPNPKNGYCFPAGPYREPRWNRRRADLVLPGPTFAVEYETSKFLLPDHSEADKPLSASVICALGQPKRLLESLEQQNITITEKRIYPDHHPLNEKGLFENLDPTHPILVTAKDWVKLRKRADIPKNLQIITRDARIDPDRFKIWLQEHLSY